MTKALREIALPFSDTSMEEGTATVTFTCDHRFVDGVIGAEFLSAFRQRLVSLAATATP
jgi:hypothetical protein